MATKRDIDAVAGADSDEPLQQPSTKRARNAGNQKKSKQSSEPQTDLTYGQRHCFPGLDHSVSNSDEDLEFEDESDALAYLKSVRQQASSIPHLLVAPKSGPQLPPHRATDGLAYDDDDDRGASHQRGAIDRSIYDDGLGDQRGYYEDGAYTAIPDNLYSNNNNDHHPDADADPEADEDAAATNEAARIANAYFTSITTRFTTLRQKLHLDPPPAALAALTREQSPHVGRFGHNSKTFPIWSARLQGADPAPAQVAAMDKGAVLRLLRVALGGKLLRRGTDLPERTSRWLWALLARLPGRGELDHMEVGYVRELGKRAALLMHSLREMAALREEVEGSGVGQGGNDDGLEGEEEDWDAEGEVVDGDVDGEGGNSAPARGEVESVTAHDLHRQEEKIPAQTTSSDPPTRSSSTVPTSNPEAEVDTKAKDEEAEDGQMEDGEVDESAPMDIDDGDFEAAKARLLANLDALDAQGPEKQTADAAADSVKEPAFDPVRARMNMRATLNMILTVAGEFYGQRDLLEFRDPFFGL
ncbi:hypothetical protein VPNG_08833 [Cytospora leucostoma]|uniref:Uncharacterized protein n=1 Tax=Cytospora leucostoma TaxID=1230097 RepID=A0A423W1I4_9PEZI|nr:hypothetical protein VPNG_08833 [Cytospora leucostoma]